MRNYVIRPAELEDLLGITLLMKQLGYNNSIIEVKKRFNEFMKLDGYGVVVACDNHEILGWLAWSKSIYFISPHTRFHIEGLVVDEQYRGHGIGKKLIEFLENYAKDYSPVIIDLTSGTRRATDGTQEFYKKLNYTNEGYMEKIYLKKEL